jgi:hypothetical protein
MQYATRMLHNHRVGLEACACAAFRSQDDNTETMWLWVGQELASLPTKCTEWALYSLLDCSMTVDATSHRATQQADASTAHDIKSRPHEHTCVGCHLLLQT